ncbi:solute carrier organic anion transporter family member 4A1-like [Bactrocera neohumeralis]|uniref:solute carrier organic anion transporter family member 4A1-like n=1 Tax=Bactrocera neohumeralis TaxID=98809 RepID=UPI0021665DD3|nr:solute carrier organic anion transporter family member 4A1-like [Bactrocera neohumeralis]XP_050324323.1 solute carrier organic anion transporter family member 4A1-like [Bactrocera neohumeralis]XP_050324324.1 solute carrier organic anion transporter family member 4A1-like [Bactrocera neohumeralis]XP_050324326.1 solute carrier organic anion transporter family member 4A1-like [Bactrocera neohumeralis]XP_050324327.1 solute carrier organic anion transporter family member 4A1-like [Bactrocera neoh
MVELEKDAQDNGGDTYRENDVATRLLDNGNVKAIENKNGVQSKEKQDPDTDPTMSEEINKLLRDMPLTDDLTCGFWIFKGRFFQRFANQTAYVLLYGIVGCVFSMTYAYFNGTITTIEKRFKIPSKNTGIISVGNDISQMMVSAVLSYYAGKGHRPRWIGFGLLTIVVFCLMTALPHLLYGPGDDALALTAEFGAHPAENATLEAIEKQGRKTLCRLNGGGAECEIGEGNLAPQLVLFVAQFISGIGGSLYYTLGVSYMDDNTKKSRTPVLLSLSYFLRMLGPAFGYALASFCLRLYIAPNLRPVINNKDPRWLGAWWLGWLVIGGMIFVSGIFLTMFPKQLPRAMARRMVEEERRKRNALKENEENGIKEPTENHKLTAEMEEKPSEDAKASFWDMLTTFKRLLKNKTLMCNNFSSVFYLFGYTPYWIFTPKYIEIQYRQSAATSSLVTGTVALAFSAAGILLSGFVISHYKPRARYMAAWNVIVGFLTVAGILAYAFIGCPGNEQSVIVNIHDSALNSTPTCNSECHCDYVRYSPVCGENNMTYISPCHAGCKKQYKTASGRKIYYDCSCIPNDSRNKTSKPLFQRLTVMDLKSEELVDDDNLTTTIMPEEWPTTTEASTLATTLSTTYPDVQLGGQAITGACPVNCFAQFVTFLSVMCCLKFVGATGRASNFLVSVRCVSEKDKTAAMGFGMMMMSMLAFIPSPIFFGWVLDRLCLVWGKTCTNKGNCWLYDPESLRYTLNITASVFVAIGALFDWGVWYYVKDLKIFDEEVKDFEMTVVQHEEEVNSIKDLEA